MYAQLMVKIKQHVCVWVCACVYIIEAERRLYTPVKLDSNRLDNGFPPVGRQALVKTNAALSSNEPIGVNIVELRSKLWMLWIC